MLKLYRLNCAPYKCLNIFLQIKDLAIFVQSDVKSTITNLLHEIMNNALAVNYSFYGAHKKKAFDKLKLYEVISSESNHFKIIVQ